LRESLCETFLIIELPLIVFLPFSYGIITHTVFFSGPNVSKAVSVYAKSLIARTFGAISLKVHFDFLEGAEIPNFHCRLKYFCDIAVVFHFFLTYKADFTTFFHLKSNIRSPSLKMTTLQGGEKYG